jgi:hypothetical protein
VYQKDSKAYKDADGDTENLNGRTLQACCAGTVTDLKVDDAFQPTLACCGAKSYDIADQECCGDSVYQKDDDKMCCGNNYVDFNPSEKTCCGGVYETEKDADGNILGFCCESDGDTSSPATWYLLADVMSKSNSPDGDEDAVWTVNAACGCKNELVSVAGGKLEGQDMQVFTNEFRCLGDKDARGPCAAAVNGFIGIPVGCCTGEHFLTSNSRCVGGFDEADTIAAGMGEDIDLVGPSYKGGRLMPRDVDFAGDGQDFYVPVDETYSKNFYNARTDLVDVYCGKSSAINAAASVVAAALIVLAL